MKNKFTKILSFGHLCADINQGALAAILPFLIAAYHYDYATAATLFMVGNFVGSFVQLYFGNLADKKNFPWIIPLGLIFAGSGFALTGVISNFYLLCVSVIVCGVGIAMFHPQAAKMVNKSSAPNNKAQNIAVFSFGGILGFTLGPIVITAAITLFGLSGSLIFVLPWIVFCIIYKIHYTEFKKIGEINSQKSVQKAPKRADNWSGFVRLIFVMFSRSIIFHGLNVFLALYFISEFNQSKAVANSFLSLYFAFTAIGTLFGGKLADKFGYLVMIRFATFAFLPIILLFIFTQNLILAVVLLLPLAVVLSFSYSPMVVLGQEYLPNRVGLASGVTLGISVSIGGIFAPILGLIADKFGLIYVFYTISAVSVIPIIFTLLLPPIANDEK